MLKSTATTAFIVLTTFLLGTVGFTINDRYPGTVSIKFLGAEVNIDGRSISIPESKQKY
jgi:hypothetical protein